MPWTEENIILTDFLWTSSTVIRVVTQDKVERGMKLLEAENRDRYFRVFEVTGKRHKTIYEGHHLGSALWHLENGE